VANQVNSLSTKNEAVGIQKAIHPLKVAVEAVSSLQKTSEKQAEASKKQEETSRTDFQFQEAVD